MAPSRAAGPAAAFCGIVARGFACALGPAAGRACDPASDAERSRPAGSPTTYPDLASVPPRPGSGRHAGAAPGDPAASSLPIAPERRLRRAAELAYATGRGRSRRRRRPGAVGRSRRPPRRRRGRRPATARVARAYLDSSLNDIRDRGKLRQFMRRLGREAPDPAGPQTLAQAVGLAPVPASAKPRRRWASRARAAPNFGDYLAACSDSATIAATIQPSAACPTPARRNSRSRRKRAR